MTDVTLAILNANVITLNPKQPKAEAIALRDKKIIAVGSNKDIQKHVTKEAEVIDARGKTVIPGLVDCHVHMSSFGFSLQTLDLRNTVSIRELRRKLREYVRNNPERSWVLGGRWDQDRFAEKRYPTRWDLDAAVADKPVFLMRVCGHIAVANSKALQLANITKDRVVDGGKIDLDPTKCEPTGIVRENALDLIWKAIPKPTDKELEKACLMACQKAVESGLSGVHWLVGSAEEMRVIRKLHSHGKLPLRVNLGIPVEIQDELLRLGLLTDFDDEMVKIGFIKILADGSLGARTAALKEPYSDMQETSGMMLYTQRKLNSLVSNAHKAGLQLGVHAIGDRAINAVLDAFEKTLKLHPRRNHRHRIEHCSVLKPTSLKRMKRLGIIASVQPHFIVSDFWVTSRVGDARARWVYALKTIMNEGVVLASGSDCPVEPISPLLGIWAAVARKTYREERLTVEEALKSYTVNAAYASFDEDQKGTIEAGKLADLTILSHDITDVAPDKIKDIQVEMVIVNGRTVYARPSRWE